MAADLARARPSPVGRRSLVARPRGNLWRMRPLRPGNRRRPPERDPLDPLLHHLPGTPGTARSVEKRLVIAKIGNYAIFRSGLSYDSPRLISAAASATTIVRAF